MPKNIIILYGLPGSGKTFYTERLKHTCYSTIVHMDDYIVDGKYKSITEVLSGLKGSIQEYLVMTLLSRHRKNSKK